MFSLMTSSFFASSLDCPDIVNLAQGLGMESTNPSIWIALKGDCCTVGGVTCNSGYVSQITWKAMALNGSINGTALPSTLNFLFLDQNKIVGIIPRTLPAGLIWLTLPKNRLTGTIPAVLPNGLQHLWLHGNQLSGNLPLLPSAIQALYLGKPGYSGNRFTGTLGLNQPNHLYINDNWITDIVIQDFSLIDPSWCDLSNNPLFGNPHLVNLSMCIQNGLYSANMLPITVSTVQLATLSNFPSTNALELADTTMNTRKNEATKTTMNALESADTTKDTRKHGATKTTMNIAPTFHGTPIITPFTLLQIIYMIIRIFINVMVFGRVVKKTPFKKEWKAKIQRKQNNKNTIEL